MPTITRRGFAGVAVSGVLFLGIAACGTDPSDGADPEGGAVQITHALGTTSVPDDVQRIVALGPTGFDVALALDAPVVGASSSGSESGLSPWTAEADGVADVEVLPVQGEATEVNLEQVAALQPDLIFAPGYFALADSYPQLSAIAPTIGYQTGPAQDTWQEMTTQLATALGRPDDAQRVIDEVETTLQETRTQFPELEGTSYTFGFVQPGSVTALRDPEDAMASVPAAIGMTLSPQILALPQGESFGVELGPEEIPALDADVLVLFDGGDAEARTALEQNALFERLPVVQRDAIVTYDYDEFIGLRNPSPLSIPWILDRIAPRLSEAAQK
ncbi:iron-siderophore ABC transporter substrate-binding protein [Pseudonocardia kongjuensis]|uniref:iron-siderophore ABC transporter substrate-binding protein n=1 Tax=Pseudonocardia kongjuensis TaxID=102227 RepID=UPI0031E3238B